MAISVRRNIATLALCALTACLALSATASASSKTVPVTLAFTGLSSNNFDAKITGELQSSNPKCVKNREIKLKGLKDTTTNSLGEFRFPFRAWSVREFPDVKATLQRSEAFGSRRNRKECSGDSARLFRSQAPMTVEDFDYAPGTNTFSGTVGASDPACLAELSVFLFRVDPETGGFDLVDFGYFDGTDGAFSLTRPSDSPGTWRVVAESGLFDFEVLRSGDAVLNTCESVNSADLTVVD